MAPGGTRERASIFAGKTATPRVIAFLVALGLAASRPCSGQGEPTQLCENDSQVMREVAQYFGRDSSQSGYPFPSIQACAPGRRFRIELGRRLKNAIWNTKDSGEKAQLFKTVDSLKGVKTAFQQADHDYDFKEIAREVHRAVDSAFEALEPLSPEPFAGLDALIQRLDAEARAAPPPALTQNDGVLVPGSSPSENPAPVESPRTDEDSQSSREQSPRSGGEPPPEPADAEDTSPPPPEDPTPQQRPLPPTALPQPESQTSQDETPPSQEGPRPKDPLPAEESPPQVQTQSPRPSDRETSRDGTAGWLIPIAIASTVLALLIFLALAKRRSRQRNRQPSDGRRQRRPMAMGGTAAASIPERDSATSLFAEPKRHEAEADHQPLTGVDRRKLDQAVEDLAQLKDSVANLRKEEASLPSEDRALEPLHEEIDGLKSSIASLETAAEEHRRAKARELETLRQHVHHLKRSIADLRVTNEGQQDWATELTELRHGLADLKRKMADLSPAPADDAQDPAEALETVRQDVDDLNSLVKNLGRTVERKLDIKAEEFEALQQSITDLKSTLDSLSHGTDEGLVSLRASISSVNAIAESQRADLEALKPLQQKTAELKSSISELDAAITDQRSQKAAIDALRQDLNSLQDLKASFNQATHDGQREFADLKASNLSFHTATQESLQGNIARLEALEDRLAELRTPSLSQVDEGGDTNPSGGAARAPDPLTAQLLTEQQLLRQDWKRFLATQRELGTLVESFADNEEYEIVFNLLKKLPRAVKSDPRLSETTDLELAEVRMYSQQLRQLSLAEQRTRRELPTGLEAQMQSLLGLRDVGHLLATFRTTGIGDKLLHFKPTQWCYEDLRHLADLFLRHYQRAQAEGRAAELEDALAAVLRALRLGGLAPIEIILGRTDFDPQLHRGRSSTSDKRYPNGTIVEVLKNGFRSLRNDRVVVEPEVVVNRL